MITLNKNKAEVQCTESRQQEETAVR